MKWFRCYGDVLHEPKITQISLELGIQKITVFGTWMGALCLAHDSPVRGSLMLSEDVAMTTETIAASLGMHIDDYDEINLLFIRYKMLTEKDGIISVKNWGKHQYESDSSRDRTRKYRAKAASLLYVASSDGHGDVTVTPPDTDTDTDTEEEKTLSSTSADYQEIRQAWAEAFPSKPQPRANNKTLNSKVKTRMKIIHFKVSWKTALMQAAQSKFLQDSSWFTLGWFLKNDDNYDKCLNGNYDDSLEKIDAPGTWAPSQEIYKEEQWQHSKT